MNRDDRGDPTDSPAEPAVLDSLLAETVTRIVSAYQDATPSRSRRDGFAPEAARHVREYLVTAADLRTPAELATETGRHRSVVYRSVERGRRIVEAARTGFSNPDRPESWGRRRRG